MVAQGQKLTHLNERGEANMVDVGSKEITEPVSYTHLTLPTKA